MNIRFKLEGTVVTGPRTQFSQFPLVLRTKVRKALMGCPVHSETN